MPNIACSSGEACEEQVARTACSHSLCWWPAAARQPASVGVSMLAGERRPPLLVSHLQMMSHVHGVSNGC